MVSVLSAMTMMLILMPMPTVMLSLSKIQWMSPSHLKRYVLLCFRSFCCRSIIMNISTTMITVGVVSMPMPMPMPILMPLIIKMVPFREMPVVMPVLMPVIIQTTLHEKWYVDICFHSLCFLTCQMKCGLLRDFSIDLFSHIEFRYLLFLMISIDLLFRSYASTYFILPSRVPACTTDEINLVFFPCSFCSCCRCLPVADSIVSVVSRISSENFCTSSILLVLSILCWFCCCCCCCCCYCCYCCYCCCCLFDKMFNRLTQSSSTLSFSFFSISTPSRHYRHSSELLFLCDTLVVLK